MTTAAEPDQAPGTAHPRETLRLVGHEAEEAAFAEALAGPRMHHAWLVAGARRIGKATLAYRAARRALGARRSGPRPLDSDGDDPVVRKIAARAHPDLFVLRRGLNERTGKPKRDIAVDDARALGHFFSMAPAEGGMRVAIVDCVDDMNRSAANAILKTLEEPPARALLILVCHAPGAALATIRSRCRKLALRPLSDDLVRAACDGEASASTRRLARGRPGFAIALKAQGGDDLAAELERGLAALHRHGANAVLPALLERTGAEAGERLELVLDVAGEWLRKQALEGENGLRWAEAWRDLNALRAEAEGLDMDDAHALARVAGVLDRAARQAP